MSGVNGSAPMREKVEFPINTAVLLKLDYDDGQLKAGRFGDQYQYTFDGSTRIAWLDPEIRDLILQTGAKAGDEIGITKRETKTGSKRRVNWEVQKVEEDHQHGANGAYNAELTARDARETKRPQLTSAPKPAPAARPKQIPIDNAREEQALLHAQLFADCITAAVHAALTSIEEHQNFDLPWDKDDIRAIATTIYINRCGGRK
jgi:hypothetical protein